MEQLTLTKVEQLGRFDDKYKNYRQTSEERKRPDIDRSKIYLTKYSDVWLLGRFYMQHYGWNFQPNLGVMSMQIEWLQEIYEIQGLTQEKGGSTAEHILGYLAKEQDEDI